IDPGAAPWLDALAQDLRHPRFRIDLSTALTRRLRRNYIWLYGILLLAWVLKITTPRLADDSTTAESVTTLQAIVSNAALGPLPGWLVIAAVAIFHIALVVAYLRSRRRADEDEVHV